MAEIRIIKVACPKIKSGRQYPSYTTVVCRKSRETLYPPLISPAIFFIKRSFSVASLLRSGVTLLEGREKHGGSGLTALFFGEDWIIPYFSELVYAGQPEKKSLGRFFIWEIKPKISPDSPEADLILIGVDKFFSGFLSRRGFIILPEWVLFTLDTSKPIPKISRSSKNRSLVADLRKIRKYNYSYEITRDPAKLRLFYDRMYSPHVGKRFGETMLHTSFQGMKKVFEKGNLLLVKRGEEYLSGSVNTIDGESVFPYFNGLLDGSVEYLRQGALAASYYFLILWAKEKGFKRIDFGHCRPFFSDGVFRYKRKWGMEVEGERTNQIKDVVGLRVCNLDRGARDFLANNPFIFSDHGRLKGLILDWRGHPLAPGEVQSLYESQYLPELEHLIVLSPEGFSREAEEYAVSQTGKKLRLVNTEPEKFLKNLPSSP